MSEDDDIQIVEARPRFQNNSNNEENLKLEALIAALKRNFLLRLSLYHVSHVKEKSGKYLKEKKSNCKNIKQFLQINMSNKYFSEYEEFIKHYLNLRTSSLMFAIIKNLRKLLVVIKTNCIDFDESPLYKKFLPHLKPGAFKSFGKCHFLKLAT